MGASRTASQSRHGKGERRAEVRNIAESPLIVLLAILVAAILVALSIALTSPRPTIILTPGPINHQAVAPTV